MDFTPLFAEAAKYGLGLMLLLTATYLLIKRQDKLETDRNVKDETAAMEAKVREQQHRADCQRDISALSEKVDELQASRYEDAKALINQAMVVLRQNAESFKQLVDIQERRTEFEEIKRGNK